MKKVTVEFSIRDRKKGQRVLMNLGFIERELLTLVFEMELDEEDIVLLHEELEELDIEFEIEEEDIDEDEEVEAYDQPYFYATQNIG